VASAAPAAFLVPCLALAGCSSNKAAPAGEPLHDAGVIDASLTDDAAADATADVDKSAPCVESDAAFGWTLTNSFGRLDGTVVAVIPPGDEACASPNDTHLIIEVMMQGFVYRMVVDVLSNTNAPDSGTDVFFYEMDGALQDGAWSEGWHTGISLDYATTLSLHSTQFAEMNQAEAVAQITSEVQLGTHISVFGTSQDEADTAHLVHRNVTNQDGAIVINPETAPHYLLLRFAEDTF
jgi:hypothetical protein